MKIAVLLYPACSLQEITTLTSILFLSFGQSLDYLASEKKIYTSEEGLQVIPDFTFKEVQGVVYDCIILPGTQEPFVSLYDFFFEKCRYQANNSSCHFFVTYVFGKSWFIEKSILYRRFIYGVGRLFFFFGKRKYAPSASCKRQECYHSYWICLYNIFSDCFGYFGIRITERFLFEKKFLQPRGINLSFRSKRLPKNTAKDFTI